ncbi:MAG: hypothetical protein US19_C0002G0015 [Candidatus Daviesbacteria bacterium GW2011_GWB1_36_5]|uniref:Methyltransferase type 11 domain-containing protein n=1 Tax=Candidatus Daviesbacteria bacterium GW2011_GWB1_36_5 TaxID=1618426 RepID=A0A0G0I3E7_9BACT|nr:MAG: hypothetical protein US19_C0002G0015 [Candidatus Daviesbacteria bacterium GW2011_GWB1_36_5]
MTFNKRIKNEIDHFTHLPEIWWGAKTAAGQKRYDNKSKIFKKLCKIDKNKKVLEIGAGYGEFTKRILDSEAQIIATDVTPKVVKSCQKKFKNKDIKFKVEDSNNLSFKSNSFDVVCGISILHHVDAEKTLKECYRVLKKGGNIFFTEPNLLNPHILLGLNIPWIRSKMEYSDDETALIRLEVEKLLKKIGFKKIHVRNYDFLHPKTPKRMIPYIERIGEYLEEIPIIKEISGSLVIYAVK